MSARSLWAVEVRLAADSPPMFTVFDSVTKARKYVEEQQALAAHFVKMWDL